MNNAASLRNECSVEQAPLPDRREVLARYGRLREIGKQQNQDVMKFVTRDALILQLRRLGLVEGKQISLDSMDDLTFAADLAVHTAPPDRTRVIDRYARSVKLVRGSEDAAMLEAMRNARFAILMVQQRHPSVGLIVTDLFRDINVWLVDVGMEASMADGAAMATRYLTPGPFAMTAGLAVPVGRGELERAIDAVPHLRRKSKAEAVQDRRFAEAVYREALAAGVMKHVQFQDPIEKDHAVAHDNAVG